MKLVILALVAVSLSGCASYGALQVACANGDTQACVDKANRDNVLGGMAYSMEMQQSPVMAPASVPVQHSQMLNQMMHNTTTCQPTYGGAFSCTTN